jgi:hypothetical protein
LIIMKILFFIILLILLILFFLEAGMLFLLRFPAVLRKCSRKLQNSIGHLYVYGERKIIQFLEGCGQYHPELGYTFKPGEFIFAEREYSNEYNINSLGVRDSEESLNQPEIVIAGDSFALGWGVDQNDTFAKILEKKAGLKTLNTAVPSYGSVREMIMLRRVDRSQLKCLIIQYCGDDYDENLRYYLNGNRPQIMRAETFQKLMEKQSVPQKYFPGKNLLLKIKKKIEESKPKPSGVEVKTDLTDVDLFLNVLQQNEDMLAHLPIIVFEINGKNQTNSFSTLLKQKAADNENPPYIQNMIVLDLSNYLGDNHFYVLDDHLNPGGHIVVADLIYKTMKEAKII